MRTRNLATHWASALAVLAGVGAAVGCSAPPDFALRDLPPTPAGSVPFSDGGRGGGDTGGTGFDANPVVTAAHTPPAVSGGTLLALQAGGRAVVSDTDRDRLLVVDVENLALLAEIALGAGAEPGRLVEDAAGRVHAVLRGSGEIVSIDATTGSVLARRSVCRAPRGIAFDKSADQLVVACLDGALVELPTAGGAATRVTTLGSDLRDVAFLDGTLAVTRFRSAEVLFLDAARNVLRTTKLVGDASGFDPSVAWRAMATADGKLAISHQRSFHGLISVSGVDGTSGASAGGTTGMPHLDVDTGVAGSSQGGGAGSGGSAGTGGTAGSGANAGTGGTAGSGGAAGGEGNFELPSSNGYGSAFEPCSSVVQGTLSFASADGSVYAGPNLEGGVLPVDIATNATQVAVAFAGTVERTSSVGVYTRDQVLAAAPTDCLSSGVFLSEPNVVAVAFDAKSGKLLLQLREPAELHVVNVDDVRGVDDIVSLGGESVFDTGHSMFHVDAGGGIACASCHPEGTDDGRIWNFSDVGTRRTQPLDVGLAGTAPFHWDGELSDFSALMDRIFVGRMGGPLESDDRQKALEEYLYALPRRPAFRDANDPGAQRGKVLFESAATGCTTCHSGPNFSNGGFGQIGKGPALQVPSLIAVSARAPYMHDGCAATLLARFDPSCGGSAHGDVSTLTSAELADLVLYLETL